MRNRDEAHLSHRNIAWVIVWVGLGLALGLWVAATQGRSAATEYYAAYLLEKSLSVDNIFVFVVIFSELHIPPEYQRRVLPFGVVGAPRVQGADDRPRHHTHRMLSMDHQSVPAIAELVWFKAMKNNGF